MEDNGVQELIGYNILQNMFIIHIYIFFIYHFKKKEIQVTAFKKTVDIWCVLAFHLHNSCIWGQSALKGFTRFFKTFLETAMSCVLCV